MTDLRKIASAMGGEVHGNVASFPTPGHSKNDRGSWATIAPGAPDGVLIHSANGGDPLAIKDQLRAKGVLPERATNENCRSRDAGAWEYTDAAGAVLYRKVRMALPNGGKSYRFEHPDGRGGWNPKRGSAPQVPYRLPDLVNAPADAIIYMAEGEKQADKLAGWGFVATSSKDWRSFDFCGYVTGRTIAILPDNDEEGARIAAAAKEAVERAGGEAFVIELPGLPAKGDVIDWTGTADELRALTETAINPPPALLDLDDVADWEGMDVPPRRWLLDDWLPIGEAALLTGAGSVGKSLVSQQLAVTIAAGKPFMGVPVEQATTLYITCEDSTEEIQRRHRAVAAMIGARIERGRCRVRSWKGELDLELATFDAERRLRPTKRFAALRETALAIGARLIVLDNTSHLFGGDENVKREVAAFVNLLNGLAAEIEGVVLLLGHPNKTGLNKPDAGDANQFGGSVAWENQVRSRMFMATVADDLDARELTNPKANYSAKGSKLSFRWHKGAFIRDEDLPADHRAEIAANVMASAENEAFMQCLAVATEQKRAVSHNPGSNFAPKVFAVMPEGKKLTEKSYRAAMERLLHLGRIELDQPLWRGPNRVMKQGIKAAGYCTDPPARTPRTDLHETRGNPARFTPPISKDIPGAANGAAAPDDDIDWGTDEEGEE